MRLNDRLGQLAYKVYFYPSLKYDEDQRDNQVNARKQQVQALHGALAAGDVVVQPGAAHDSARDRARLDEPAGRTSRSIDSRSRRSTGCRSTCSTSAASGCCRSSARLSGAPNEAYQALSIADAKFPEVTLSTGENVTMSYGQYRAVLATNRNQADRRAGVSRPLRHVRRRA